MAKGNGTAIGEFGRTPYRRAWFGPRSSMALGWSTGTISALDEALRSFECSREEGIDRLSPLLGATSPDLRGYAGDLYAAACTRIEVNKLGSLFDAAESDEEVTRAFVCLACTQCPESVEIAMSFRASLVDDRYDEYVSDVAALVLGLEFETPFDDFDRVNEECHSAIAACGHGSYYFRGRPAFLGDLTKAVIEAAAVSMKERRPFALSYEPWMLTCSRGQLCPIRYGDVVEDQGFSDLMHYVEELSLMSFLPGKKYFSGEKIPE